MKQCQVKFYQNVLTDTVTFLQTFPVNKFEMPVSVPNEIKFYQKCDKM